MKSTLIINSYNFSSDKLLQSTVELIGYLNSITDVCIVTQGRISDKQKEYLRSKISSKIKFSKFSFKCFAGFYAQKGFVFMSNPKLDLFLFVSRYLPKFAYIINIRLDDSVIETENNLIDNLYDFSLTLDDLFLNLAVFEYIIKLKCTKQKGMSQFRNLPV